jgi:hypothetical protein
MNLTTYLQWSGAAPVLVALCVLALCAVIGLAALSALMGSAGAAQVAMRHWPVPLQAFLGATLGMCMLVFALFVLACVGQLHTRAVAVTVGLGLGVALVRLWQNRGGLAQAWPKAHDPFWAGVVLALALLLWLVWRSVQPPGLWDDTMYQLPQARLFAMAHTLAVDPYLRFPLFPYNANLLFAGALLFGNEVDAQILATLPLFLIGLGFLGLARHLTGSYLTGWLAVLVLAGLGPTSEALGYAYVDAHLALYAWAGLVTLVLGLQAAPGSRLQQVCVLLSGVFMGTAAGTKLFGVVMAAWVFVLILLNQRSLGRAWALYLLAGSLFGLGWYVRSFFVSGDPIHPLGGAWFGHYLWTAEDLASARTEQATHGAARGWDMLWRGMHVAGLLPLVPALVVPMWSALRGRVWWALYAAFLGYLAFWLLSSQVARYTAPLWAVGAFLSGASIHSALQFIPGWRQARVWSGRLSLVASWAMGLGLSGLVVTQGHQAFSQRAASWNAALMSRPGYEIFTLAGNLAAQHGPVLMQLGYENAVYFFGGTVVGDWFGPARYGPLLRCAERCSVVGPQALAEVTRQHGARMVAVHSSRFSLDVAVFQSHFSVLHSSRDGVLLLLRD